MNKISHFIILHKHLQEILFKIDFSMKIIFITLINHVGGEKLISHMQITLFQHLHTLRNKYQDLILISLLHCCIFHQISHSSLHQQGRKRRESRNDLLFDLIEHDEIIREKKERKAEKSSQSCPFSFCSVCSTFTGQKGRVDVMSVEKEKSAIKQQWRSERGKRSEQIYVR